VGYDTVGPAVPGDVHWVIRQIVVGYDTVLGLQFLRMYTGSLGK